MWIIPMILIERKIFTSKSTIGALSINGNAICYTLEDVARPLGVKVPKETCIPAGNYSLEITQSVRFKRALPLIYNSLIDLSVTDGIVSWTGVRIHPGNSMEDTEGCILVGVTPGHDWVSGSIAAMDKLFPILINMATSGPIELKIINNQN